MKTKYFLIYIGIGVAFLAASLWVLLSGGKNAKAIRAKYKLGGALLTTWALLSAASCGLRIGGGDPQVLCYDVAMMVNEVSVSDTKDGDCVYADGDVMAVEIDNPVNPKYTWEITDPEAKTLIQKGEIKLPEDLQGPFRFDITIHPGTYKGAARFSVSAVYFNSEGQEEGTEVICNLQLELK